MDGIRWTHMDAARSNGLEPGYMIPIEMILIRSRLIVVSVGGDRQFSFLLLEAVVLDNKKTINIDTSCCAIRSAGVRSL